MTELSENPGFFRVGDRVLVTDGYDAAAWLKGGPGYAGTLIDLLEDWATVELDEDLVLDAEDTSGGWQDFGSGSLKPVGTLMQARGRWLGLTHGWEGQAWSEPIGRLHVGLCPDKPDLRKIPSGGGVGAWVESHARMEHLDKANQD